MTWAPDYGDVASLRTYIRAGLDSDQDVFLQSWITATSRNVDDFTGRQFGNTGTAQARVYDPVYDRALQQYIYEIDDIQNVTGLAITTSGGTAVTSYTLWPRNAVAKGKVYTQLRTTTSGVTLPSYSGSTPPPNLGTLTISAIFGWNAVPAAATEGMYLQAARLAKRRDSPFGVAGSPAEGSELRLLAQLDPDFRTTLQPYVRKWWAA